MGQSLSLIVFFVLISYLFVCSSQYIHGSEFAINCIFCVNFLFVCSSQYIHGSEFATNCIFCVNFLFVSSQYIHVSEFAINCIFCVNFLFVSSQWIHGSWSSSHLRGAGGRGEHDPLGPGVRDGHAPRPRGGV